LEKRLIANCRRSSRDSLLCSDGRDSGGGAGGGLAFAPVFVPLFGRLSTQFLLLPFVGWFFREARAIRNFAKREKPSTLGLTTTGIEGVFLLQKPMT